MICFEAGHEREEGERFSHKALKLLPNVGRLIYYVVSFTGFLDTLFYFVRHLVLYHITLLSDICV